MALADPKKARITHVLRDGTVLDSIEGHVVRFEDAEPVYRLMYEMTLERARKAKRSERSV